MVREEVEMFIKENDYSEEDEIESLGLFCLFVFLEFISS